MDIKIGELNKRISIVIIYSVQNDNGFEEEQDYEYCKCWAKVANMSGTEVFKAGTNYATKTTRFLIRYRKDKLINETMKIRFNNILYNIKYINNYNYSNEFIELIGEVVQNG